MPNSGDKCVIHHYWAAYSENQEGDSNVKKFKLYCKHILLVLAIIGGVLLMLSLISMLYNPMLRPTPMIRCHILRHTPIGMDMEEVIEIIENNARWGSSMINRESGFRNPSLSVEGSDGRPTAATVGVKSIQTNHRYSIPLFLDRSVRIWWGFNENGKLIDVYVVSWFVI